MNKNGHRKLSGTCNPYKLNVDGHVMFATKKISPGGHWINITALACKQTHADVAKTTEAYACVAVTMADRDLSVAGMKNTGALLYAPKRISTIILSQSWDATVTNAAVS